MCASMLPAPAGLPACALVVQDTLKGTASRDVTMDMLDGTRELAAAAKSMPVNPGGGRLRGGA